MWTGSELFVWGGFDGSNYRSDGSRYDLALDQWTPTINSGAPSPRMNHTAVWSGTEMIVWGGLRFNGINNMFLDDAYAYTPPRTMFLYLKP